VRNQFLRVMGSLHELLARDHDRLDSLLAAVVRDDGTIDGESYDQFRRGLLWHIAVEEKVLFPSIRAASEALPLLDQLHRDHAALAALLVPPPSARGLEIIRTILNEHNPLEEGIDGLYEIAAKLGVKTDDAHAIPPVPTAPHADSEATRRSIEQLLRERKGDQRINPLRA
jgi:hypothetical protein